MTSFRLRKNLRHITGWSETISSENKIPNNKNAKNLRSITRSRYDRRVSQLFDRYHFVDIKFVSTISVSTSTLRWLSSPKPSSMPFPSREIANAIKYYLTSIFWHLINLILSQTWDCSADCIIRSKLIMDHSVKVFVADIMFKYIV